MQCDIDPSCWPVEESRTDEETVNHAQIMRRGDMDVNLIESDDDVVDMGPSYMTHLECNESLKGVTSFIA